MKRVLQYILHEVKEGRLSKPGAVELAREIHTQGHLDQPSVPHPLLHRNTSDLSAQRFSTRLSGEEAYLSGVNGARVLPDVAHLEMARAAVAAAAGEDARDRVRPEQVEWLQPVVVGSEGLDLHVELFAEEDGKTGYEIYSGAAAADDEARLIHSHGWFAIEAIEEQIIEPKIPAENIFDTLQTGNVQLTPVWEPAAVGEPAVNWPSPADQVVIVGGTSARLAALRESYPRAQHLNVLLEATPKVIAEQFRALGNVDHIVWLAPEERPASLSADALIEGQRQGVMQCFHLIKALLALGYGSRALGWTVITTQVQAIHPDETVNPTHASVHGLVGSMAKEYAKWKIRLVDLEADRELQSSEIFSLPPDRRAHAWISRNGIWYRHQLIRTQSTPPSQKSLFRNGGVYVIIGGAGDVGQIFSEYLVRAYRAQIVWIGRREKDAAIQAKLDHLATLGCAGQYISADAANRDALQRACEAVKQRYGKIHGVVHAAMVFSSHSLEEIDDKKFRAALSAKVDVSVRIAQVFEHEPLDFVLFFSSLISFIKNPKQSHYASGCAFKDAFAGQLAQKWLFPVRTMNWGYWGQSFPRELAEEMRQTGLGFVDPVIAMQSLESLLLGPLNQVGLISTTKPIPVEGVSLNEWISIHSDRVPSLSDRLPNSENQPALGAFRALKNSCEQAFRSIEALLGKLLFGQLNSLVSSDGGWGIDAWKTSNGLNRPFDRWLQESLDILAALGYLKKDGETYSAVQEAVSAPETIWREWDACKDAWRADAGVMPYVNLVDTTLRALPEILGGTLRVTDVMLPNGSLALVEAVYKNNPIADYFNDALAGMAVAFIEERLKQNASARIRILEVGAGTGGTSARVFARLKPYADHIEEYRYTDLSQAFLLHAQTAYGPDNPYVTYGIFNVEKPISGQRIEADSYDLVIAANVLHATRDIRRTLRNVKAALRTNGLLLLNEISRASLFTHLTFGLLEGWWLFEDENLRIPGCPGLSSEGWRTVLNQERFRSIFHLAAEAHALGQQIIAAESDGVTRRTEAIPCRATSDVTEGHKDPAGRLDLRTPSIDRESELLEKIRTSLVQEVSLGFKLKVEDIDLDRELSEYGFDSISFTALAHQLNQLYGLELMPTMFFEHPTLGEVARHLAEHHRGVFAARFAPVARPALVPTAESRPDLRAPSIDREGELLEKIRTSLVQEVSLGFKLKVEDIALDRELSEYGFELDQFYGAGASTESALWAGADADDVLRTSDARRGRPPSGRTSPRGVCGKVCSGGGAGRRSANYSQRKGRGWIGASGSAPDAAR